MSKPDAPQEHVTEGKATILFTKNEAFYNPVQQFNRDLSITILSIFSESLRKKEEERAAKKGKPCEFKGVTVLEALAATGLRSVRYALEAEGVEKIVANDIDPSAIEAMKRNFEFNKIPEGKIQLSQGDAIDVMYRARPNPKIYDAIDLDPYGSAVEFLDAAVQAVRNGGLLMVTCTDMAVLCGNHPEVCCVKYGSTPLKEKYCHEFALRILLQFIERTANKYRRHMVPLLSVSVDYYVRVFVRVVDSAVAMKDTPQLLSMVHQCPACDTFYLQPLGKKTVDDRKVSHYQPAMTTAPCFCESCGKRLILGGPIWTGALHDDEMLDSILAFIKEHPGKFGTEKRIIAKVTVMKEELKDVPLFTSLDSMCNTLRIQTPPRPAVIDAITKLGYRVSTFHDFPQAVKTDLPFNMLWDIFKTVAKQLDVQQPENTPGYAIMQKPITTENIVIDLSTKAKKRPADQPARFLLMPPKWGPGVKAGRKRTPEENAARTLAKKERRRKREMEAAFGASQGESKKERKDTETPDSSA